MSHLPFSTSSALVGPEPKATIGPDGNWITVPTYRIRSGSGWIEIPGRLLGHSDHRPEPPKENAR